MKTIKKHIILSTFLLLNACSTSNAPSTIEKNLETVSVTIFSINDFHGNLQADKPVPLMITSMAETNNHPSIAAGGYPYLASLLKQRRLEAPNNILVGAGDLIGASPIGSAILNDEPVIEALNALDLSVTALGNHELDHGAQKFKDKLEGKCPQTGCAFPGFTGAKFDYIAANVINRSDARPWLKPYVIRQVAGVNIAFIGAVTIDTANIVSADGIKNLRFEDEALAINRYIPEIKQQGVAAIVVLIHEGGNHRGAANDPSYACEGLQGRIIEINKKLDPAINLVISGHTHQAYTCKHEGRLVVQAKNYGAYLTETTLLIDKKNNQVITANAHNHLVDQSTLPIDPHAQQLNDKVMRLTTTLRSRPIAKLVAPLTRQSNNTNFDSTLGNVVADAQLHFAKQSGNADIAFMNTGGIRNDLPSGTQASPIEITFGDLYAVQPFRNQVISMKLTGAQILQLLQEQWQARKADDPKKLYVSQGFTYQWNPKAEINSRISALHLNGNPIDMKRYYTIVTNSFLADGGDGFSIFKEGQQRQILGQDIEALELYITNFSDTLHLTQKNRVQRIDH